MIDSSSLRKKIRYILFEVKGWWDDEDEYGVNKYPDLVVFPGDRIKVSGKNSYGMHSEIIVTPMYETTISDAIISQYESPFWFWFPVQEVNGSTRRHSLQVTKDKVWSLSPENGLQPGAAASALVEDVVVEFLDFKNT